MDKMQVGATKRFELSARKNGLVWDFTSATVTLRLKHPDGSVTDHSASIDSPATAGVAYFNTATTTLNVPGTWSRWWKIVDGSITDYTDPVKFRVYDPAKA